jgi:3,4-dihydroxy 2-butanone 4-phosphate synthase/GTP cyclohydrolase II
MHPYRKMKKIIQEAQAKLPTHYYGEFTVKAFNTGDDLHHVAMIKGDVKGKKDVLVRVHSECLTGDVLHSMRCDCGEQLESALKMIDKAGLGVLVYLRQEGRGIGLFNKIKAYELQDQGMDTVQANEKLGFKADARDYSLGAAILKKLGLTTIKLLTNNPKKIEGLEKYGLKIVERIPIIIPPNVHNKHYLSTKKSKLGHLIEDKGIIKD